jgi:asparaginyl-tRNA synthetase
MSLSTHQFFGDRGFLNIHTPLITSCDAEGGGDVFELRAPGEITPHGKDSEASFFGHPAYLSVSGQLHAEALATAHGDVYSFGPAFRAENSHTTRHLAELWMVEPEMAWADLSDSAALAEEYLRSVLGTTLSKCAEDFELLAGMEAAAASHGQTNGSGAQELGEGLLARPSMADIEAVLEPEPWVQLTYAEAISLLQAAEAAKPLRFAKPAPQWGDDLAPEHERYLCHHGGDGRPVIVRDYPREAKSFYMRQNDDGRTVAAMDVLFPRLAEVVGGGQREERLELLVPLLSHRNLTHARTLTHT